MAGRNLINTPTSSITSPKTRSIPIGPKVVPFWDPLINSTYEPPKGTTSGPMGRVELPPSNFLGV